MIQNIKYAWRNRPNLVGFWTVLVRRTFRAQGLWALKHKKYLLALQWARFHSLKTPTPDSTTAAEFRKRVLDNIERTLSADEKEYWSRYPGNATLQKPAKPLPPQTNYLGFCQKYGIEPNPDLAKVYTFDTPKRIR